MPFEDISCVVIDSGSQFTKGGFGGEHFPRCVIPTVVGRFRHGGLLDVFPDYYIGEQAIKHRGLSNSNWPVRDGLIKDWDGMEKIWFHMFYRELHVPPEQLKILLSVHPLIPKGDREKIAEIMFESFSVSALNLVTAPVLSLYSSGRTTGVVYENGACSSYVLPIFEGFPLKYNIITSTLTGEAISDILNDMLKTLGYSFTTPFEKQLVDNIKEKVCYVASNYKEEYEKFSSSGENKIKYDLPDGQHILLGEERFKCPEVLFQPSIRNLTCPSIVDNIRESIEKCDLDIKAKLYENIVLSGGSTMMKGLLPRLTNELAQRVKKMPGFKAVIHELPMRQNAVWVGGSILATLNGLKGFWMTRQEYEDIGTDRVNYKFF